ncbi:hypothetical protein FRB99_000156 [Tulasnella sp. 403]|nr:hypothetical protein FRB99_000156 [Tulasnella sp. 403]
MRSSLLLRTGIPVLVIVALYTLSHPYHESIKAKLPEMPSLDVSLPWSTNHPPPRNLSEGHWEPYKPLVDEVELWGESNCRIDTSDGKDRHDIPKETKARVTAMNNWQWVIDDGLSLSNWTSTAFIERVIQNRFGMLIIGDSLSGQMMVALQTMLSPPKAPGQPLILTTRGHDVYMDKRYPNITEAWFNKKHPLYRQLQEKYPQVPRERFDQPLVTCVRTDIMITDPELDQIMHDIGNETPVQKFFRSQGDWRAVLNKYANHPGWEGELPGLVITNTGAHWNSVYMAPTKLDDLAAAYDKMLDLVSDSLTHFAQRMPFRVLFRSISPPHTDCGKYNSPVAPSDPATVLPEDWRGWQIFSRYNDMARTKYAPNYDAALSGRPAYWDIWTMSVVRPDAHVGYNGPGWDCVHWCSPSVLECI